MNCKTISRRIAASGGVAALAAGALVGATTTPAVAAEGTTTYVCETPVGPQSVSVTTVLADLPDTLQAGQEVTESFTAPLSLLAGGDLAAALDTYGLTALTSGDFDLPFGSETIPVRGIGLAGVSPGEPAGSLVVTTTGASNAFRAPAAGAYDVTMPEAFTLTPTLEAIGGQVDAACATEDPPAVLDEVEVLKNDSSTTGKATKKSFKKGTVAKLKSTVTGDVLTPAGKVVAKKGAKTYKATLDDNGVAVINLGKNLKPGKHEFALAYAGSGYHKGSQAAAPVVVKVVK